MSSCSTASFAFFLIWRFILLYECFPWCMHMYHIHAWSRRSEEGVESFRTEVSDGCDPLCRVVEIESGSFTRATTALTAEPSLQSSAGSLIAPFRALSAASWVSTWRQAHIHLCSSQVFLQYTEYLLVVTVFCIFSCLGQKCLPGFPTYSVVYIWLINDNLTIWSGTAHHVFCLPAACHHCLLCRL